MTDEESNELKRQSLLLEELNKIEGFRIWRKEVIEPVLDQIDALIANSDALSEPVLRAKVQLRYLVKDLFYGIFDRVKASNDVERENS